MRDVVWSDEALDDFDSAIYFVAKDSKRSADLIADRIERAVDFLADMPTGRLGRVRGTYERVVQKTPYIIAYTLSDAAVRIVRIIHGARDWPEGEWPAE
jgi:plasmid stabilization system protein ParE